MYERFLVLGMVEERIGKEALSTPHFFNPYTLSPSSVNVPGDRGRRRRRRRLGLEDAWH